MLFGQFVGDWEIRECRFLKKDGSWGTSHGELHWGWILGGTAVQDVWIGVAGEAHGSGSAGTTVRYFDSERDQWRSIWISPGQNEIRMFTGLSVEDEIVLTADEGREKWIFHDIQKMNSSGAQKESTKRMESGTSLNICGFTGNNRE